MIKLKKYIWKKMLLLCMVGMLFFSESNMVFAAEKNMGALAEEQGSVDKMSNQSGISDDNIVVDSEELLPPQEEEREEDIENTDTTDTTDTTEGTEEIKDKEEDPDVEEKPTEGEEKPSTEKPEEDVSGDSGEDVVESDDEIESDEKLPNEENKDVNDTLPEEETDVEPDNSEGIVPSDDLQQEVVPEEEIKETQPLVELQPALKIEEVEEKDGDPGEGRASGYVDSGFYDEINLMSNGNYEHNSRFDGYTIKNGIDVSKYQGEIDWEKVKADGVDFAYIRLGYRGYGSAGNMAMDDRYYDNIEGALDAGLQVGVYFFSQATGRSEARAEADYILAHLNNYKISLPIVMDFEYASDASGLTGRLYNANLSKEEATAICRDFCKVIEADGYEAMVYANKDMLTNHLNAEEIAKDYKIWLAHYTSKTNYSGTYSFWQYSDSEYVDGINGRVDRDFWYVEPKKEEIEQPTESVSIAEGVYTLSSALDTQMVVDVSNGSISNGANIQLYSANESDAQRFYIHAVGDKTYILISAASGKVLEVKDGNTGDRANVCQNAYNGSLQQKWWVTKDTNGYYTLVSSKSGKVLDVSGGSSKNGANIQQYTYNGSAAQKFALKSSNKKNFTEGTYVFLSALAENKALEISNGSSVSGANVQLNQINGSEAQHFKVSYNGDGTYSLKAEHSGKALDVKSGAYTNGTNVWQYDFNGSAAQKWLVRNAGDGRYVFISAASGKVLDVNGASTKNGANIQVYEYNGTNAQKWKILKKRVSVAEGVYTFSSALSGDMVLDIASANVQNNANVQIYTSNGTEAQKFYLRNVGDNTYVLISLISGKVLEVAGGSNTDRANVCLNPYSGFSHQKWWLFNAENGYYTLMSVSSGKVLDISGGNAKNGANVQQYMQNGSNAQKFSLKSCNRNNFAEGTYVFQSALASNKVLDISSGSRSDGANVQLYQMNGSGAQNFKVSYNGDGTYTIKAEHSGKALDVKSAAYANGTNVWQYTANGSAAQKWLIRGKGNGTYILISAVNGKVLDVSGGSTKNRANVQCYEYNNSNAQKWIPVKKRMTVAEGIYMIPSALSVNMCLDIPSASLQNKVNVQLHTANHTDAQRYYFHNIGNGVYILISCMSGKVLEVADGNIGNGARIRQNAYSGLDSQKWYLLDRGKGYYTLMSMGTGKVLDVANGNAQNGAKIQQYVYNGSNAQRFSLKPDNQQRIKNDTYVLWSALARNKVLDVSSGSSADGANVQLYQMNNSSAQRFKISYNGDGTYTLKAEHSGKVLDVANGSYVNGSNVRQYTSNHSAAQRWLIRDTGNGNYVFMSAASGKVLDVLSGKTENGTNIQIDEQNGSDRQKFRFSGEVTVSDYPGLVAKDKFKIKSCTAAGYDGTRLTVSLKAQSNSKAEQLSNEFYLVMLSGEGNYAWNAGKGTISKGDEFTIQASFSSGDNFKTAAMSKYAIAVKSSTGYWLISDAFYLSNPNIFASKAEDFKDKYWGYYEGYKITSKKGIQGVSDAYTEDLRVQHVLLNVDLADMVSPASRSGYIPYTYKGQTYYFQDLIALKKTIYNLHGWGSTEGNPYGENHMRAVTLNLLLSWRDDVSYLIHPDARVKGAASYYALNMQEERARNTYEALFCYMGEELGQYKERVSNWTLGNEVNSCKAWNYSGNMSLQECVANYAEAFQILYQGVQRTASSSRMFISLDHCWNAADAGHSGKAFLDEFAAYMDKTAPAMRWNVNYHPYSQPLNRTEFWSDYSNTTDAVGTRYISMRNIQVLTDYLSTLEAKYGKPSGSIRVILGEMGFSAPGGNTGAEHKQAAALGYGYYKTMFNTRIDAYIIRAYLDAPAETSAGLYLGLRRADTGQTAKISYDLYKNLDTSQTLRYMDPYKSTVGVSSWESAIAGFDAGKLVVTDF
ncbi:MAG: RICIN domain-containing protein [Clostridiales bacterium]|nr:RICIN domain-containing protein [Clostridiales bacterium]